MELDSGLSDFAEDALLDLEMLIGRELSDEEQSELDAMISSSDAH